jgi:hypothetical protein
MALAFAGVRENQPLTLIDGHQGLEFQRFRFVLKLFSSHSPNQDNQQSLPNWQQSHSRSVVK